MKFIILLYILAIVSCNDSVTHADQDPSEPLTKKDSLWLARNNFLAHPVFHDSIYQALEFKKYEGLWTCVRTERNSDNKVEIPKYSDLLFSDRKAWMLDYPCSWNMQYYVEDVHFRNDSIFFSADRVYIEKKQIEFRGDTLAIFGTNKWDESEYYVRKSYDSLILADLKERGFNENCFEGKWELNQIGNGASDTWVIQDGFLDHVPRFLDFSKTEFVVEGIYLINSYDRDIKFEITQYDRSYDDFYGEESWLWIKELNEIEGTEYEYMYQPTSD